MRSAKWLLERLNGFLPYALLPVPSVRVLVLMSVLLSEDGATTVRRPWPGRGGAGAARGDCVRSSRSS
ncbi:hypothetical protein GCM10018793_11780 [Streptomyces sulfonofaciens]|uniref:Uncharacterized protein n=1 Tax=Streptomyces sulfonofaciens TaxID=68272 RepID=A0A919FWD3_9ACTN|nr:hypothetical protein GCM10018793_11780 [Streptomyces sulfonofaciens]